jgi:hypothetical protein
MYASSDEIEGITYDSKSKPLNPAVFNQWGSLNQEDIHQEIDESRQRDKADDGISIVNLLKPFCFLAIPDIIQPVAIYREIFNQSIQNLFFFLKKKEKRRKERG